MGSNKTLRKSAFYNFLTKQKDRVDPIGDLSADVCADKSFPLDTNSLEKIKDYLICNSACSESIQALDEAFSQFKSNKIKRSGLSLSLRFDVFRRDGYRCQICGAATRDDDVRLEVDHKIPVASGGGDEMNNLWTLCFSCNRGKSAKSLY